MAEPQPFPANETGKPTLSERMARPATGATKFEKLVLFGGVDAAEIWLPRQDQPVERDLSWRFGGMCAKRNIPTPKLLLYKSDKANAMCLTNGTVAVSTALLESFSPAQVDAVLQHELTHWEHRTRSFVFKMAAFWAPIVATGAVWWHTGSKWLRDKPFFQAHKFLGEITDDAGKFVIALASALPGKIFSASVSRHYERVADRRAAEEGYGRPLAEVLQSMDAHAAVEMEGVGTARAHRGDGDINRWIKKATSSHPSTGERLKNLGIQPSRPLKDWAPEPKTSWMDAALSTFTQRFYR